jgi:hypothetical protein
LSTGVIAAPLLAVTTSAASPVGVYAAAGRYLDPVFGGVRAVNDAIDKPLERNAMVGKI